MKMKKVLLLTVIAALAVAAQAAVIDNFDDGDVSDFIPVVMLDNSNPAVHNVAALESVDGKVQVVTAAYSAIEQTAYVKPGYLLKIGQEIQLDFTHNGGNRAMGLFAGIMPTENVRANYITVYGEANTINTRGFNGTTEMTIAAIQGVAYTKMFIRRYGQYDYLAGFYDAAGKETILKNRIGLNFGGASDIVVGLYSDIRAQGIIGTGDNLAIISMPTDPAVVQTQDGTNNVDVLLQWNAAADPNGGISGLEVDPDIMDQYVFVGDGNDPNLYYKGAAGDPGNTPASSFDLQDSVQNDLTYRWAVVEAMSDYGQTLTVNGSTLDDVDPNDTIGPIWSFNSLTSIPIITKQPANVRAFETNASAVLTCEFFSVNTATVLWYKTGIVPPLAAGGDIVINTTRDAGGNVITTLEILTPALADEGDYYCTINNGTPLLTSNTASLVIKRLLAQYDFDGTLSPAAGSVADAPAGQGKSLEGLAEPNSLAASDVTLAFVEGVDGAAGSAVQIDARQYVDFGVEGYPKAYAALSNGCGGGLDEGTIVFWVKPNVNVYQIILGNFNETTTGTGFLAALQADQDFDLLIRSGGTYLANHVAGRPDRPEYDLIDGNWHLMAACWGGNTSALYVDGQPVASNIDAEPASYDAWQRGTLLGSTRMSSNRDFLTDMFAGGAIDNLRIYNYRLDAESKGVFAQEYLDATGIVPCLDPNFTGNEFNVDNTGSSYCTVNLADFAVFASAWLQGGLYDAP